jgi:pimeloyl-ACP methyl ester carboxylesterase
MACRISDPEDIQMKTLALLIILLAPICVKADERIRIPVSGISEKTLFVSLLHVAPATKLEDANRVVLFVHGATFPSALAAGYRFEGHSWMDDLSKAGFDVWALDFIGYGDSDRYPEMSHAADVSQPLGRADIAAKQIEAAVKYICVRQKMKAVSIIAHSWGTLAAGVFTAGHNSLVRSLVLFGPVAQRNGSSDIGPRQDAWSCVNAEAQRSRFTGYVPSGETQVFKPEHLAHWLADYLNTDGESSKRIPSCVRVPNGPEADINKTRNGKFLYDPSSITVPVLIIRGEWDTVTKSEDAQWLFKALTHAPVKRDVLIDHATHVMHLEQNRFQLFREVQLFLQSESLEE